MTATILITGFGPFPGAPFNPSEPLALELARRRHPAFAGVRRVAHVFRVTYEAVDTELPALIAREKPAALVMFGLAARTKHVRIETRARNVVTRILPDADGQIRTAANIAPGAPVALSLRAPAHRLLLAAFLHVPTVRRAQVQRPRAALTLDDLARAGEAIVRTALAAARPFGADKPPIP